MEVPRSVKIIFIVYGLLILLIPTGTFLLAKRFQAKQDANTNISYNRAVTKTPKPTPSEVPKTNPLQSLALETSPLQQATDSGIAQISGPSLSFRITLEGRPPNKQAAKVFIGLASGEPTTNPKYLLSFNINVPDSGKFEGLSLAGLNLYQRYTAYIKGPAQIATASAFTVKPTLTDLGDLSLVTGDLNDDNVIDNSDLTIAKAASGATPASQKWNANIDFNLDQIINNFDLSLIQKNLNKIGSSGPWYSKISSNSSNPPIGGEQNLKKDDDGYWMWVPKI